MFRRQLSTEEGRERIENDLDIRKQGRAADVLFAETDFRRQNGRQVYLFQDSGRLPGLPPYRESAATPRP